MKMIGKMIGWHWRLVWVPFGLLCGVYGVQQAVLVLLSASSKDLFGNGLTELFLRCGQMPLFFVAMFLVAVIAAAAARSSGRAHSLYTVYTLPHSRRNLPVVQFLLCLLLLLLFGAWQLILYAVLYLPVTMVSAGVTAEMVSVALPQGSLLAEFNANPLMQLLLPVSPKGWGGLIAFLGVLSLESACMACCHGIRRVFVSLAALVGAGTASSTLYLWYHLVVYAIKSPGEWLLLAFLAGTAALSAILTLFNAWWSVKRTEAL